MKIIFKILIVLLLVGPLTMNAQVEFIEVETLEQMKAAQKKASDQMLMLFVDVYATWCGPCKMMDSEVYTDPNVAEYMNAHYVNVRLDGESDYGRNYVIEQQLEGYPSMFIFSDDGERVGKIVGFTQANELVTTLTSVSEGFSKMKSFRASYQKGTLEPQGFADYITVVRDMGNQEEAERLASEYMEQVMESKSRLSDSDIRVVAFYMDLDDTWWAGFSSDPERLRRVLGEDYMLAMEKIYNNTLVKAVEEERIDLISLMANELAPLVESEASSWDLRSLPFIQYYYYTNQTEKLISYIDQRFATDRKDDHRWLYSAASQITDMDQQYRTEVLLRKELEWYKICIDLEEHFDYDFYKGMVHIFLGENNEAEESFLKAESLASTQEQQEMIAQVMGFINSR
ncbi:MAG: thioredoxin domain-containing protein [Bacteroidota bacterium]|nr:thioredoxin domain-containing protein [Bacteroidota bacterium]